MNPDEIDVDPSLIRRLVAGQFADWADLPITELASPEPITRSTASARS